MVTSEHDIRTKSNADSFAAECFANTEYSSATEGNTFADDDGNYPAGGEGNTFADDDGDYAAGGEGKEDSSADGEAARMSIVNSSGTKDDHDHGNGAVGGSDLVCSLRHQLVVAQKKLAESCEYIDELEGEVLHGAKNRTNRATSASTNIRRSTNFASVGNILSNVSSTQRLPSRGRVPTPFMPDRNRSATPSKQRNGPLSGLGRRTSGNTNKSQYRNTMLEQLRLERAEIEIDELLDENETQRIENEKLRAQVNSLHSEKQKVDSLLAVQKHDFTELECVLEERVHEIERLKSSKIDSDNLKSSSRGINRSHTYDNTCSKGIGSEESTNSQTDSQDAYGAESNSRLCEEQQRSKTEILACALDLDTLKSTHVGVRTLSEQVTEANRKIEELRSQLEAANAELEEMTALEKANREQLEQARNDREQMTSEMSSKLSQMSSKLSEVEIQNVQLEQTNADLAYELENVERNVSRNNKDIHETDALRQEAEKKLAEVTKECKTKVREAESQFRGFLKRMQKQQTQILAMHREEAMSKTMAHMVRKIQTPRETGLSLDKRLSQKKRSSRSMKLAGKDTIKSSFLGKNTILSEAVAVASVGDSESESECGSVVEHGSGSIHWDCLIHPDDGSTQQSIQQLSTHVFEQNAQLMHVHRHSLRSLQSQHLATKLENQNLYMRLVQYDRELADAVKALEKAFGWCDTSQGLKSLEATPTQRCESISNGISSLEVTPTLGSVQF